jgi:wyosine [tRNA(Phe)-imidazoG37] synthetase (radical SAM superfamily)
MEIPTKLELYLMPLSSRNKYVYGPVRSWRSGTSLGIDPIGDISTCSFNCVYCQLGKIQKITTESKIYVPTEFILEDLKELEELGEFSYQDLDVITFAGSGEPTLAENLAELITSIKNLYADQKRFVPISVLTNATTLMNPATRAGLLTADQISLKLDAYDDEILKKINQPAEGITMDTIINGIKLLVIDSKALTKPAPKLQLQIMLMPKILDQEKNYTKKLADLILELNINHLQLNTPSRPKPISKSGEYWIDTRGNHYAPSSPSEQVPDYIEFRELPIITKEQAFMIEDELNYYLKPLMPDLKIINIFKRES